MRAAALELIDSDDALYALRPLWEHLWRRARAASPFQSPAWLLPWWRAFGTGSPRIAVLRDEDRLDGVLPLYVLEEGGTRKLLPLGAGLTDYQDVLLADDARGRPCAELLGLALDRAAREEVAVCDLTDLPPGARLRAAEAPRGWQAAWRQADPCPVLAVEDGMLAGVVPARTLRKLRMNRHRAARRGGWTCDIADRDSLPVLLDALFDLHTARWGGAGVLRDDRVRTFHREAAPLLLAQGSLRLQVLRLDATIVAASYVLLMGTDRLLFYLSGYDTRFAFESPGSVLLGEMIEAGVAEGRREFHFLRGGEGYKYAWGAVDRLNAACRLTK